MNPYPSCKRLSLALLLLICQPARAEYGCNLSLNEIPDRVGVILTPLLAPHDQIRNHEKQPIVERLQRLQNELDLCEEHYYSLVGTPEQALPSSESQLVALYDRSRMFIAAIVESIVDEDAKLDPAVWYRFLGAAHSMPGGVQVIIHPAYPCPHEQRPQQGGTCDA